MKSLKRIFNLGKTQRQTPLGANAPLLLALIRWSSRGATLHGGGAQGTVGAGFHSISMPPALNAPDRAMHACSKPRGGHTTGPQPSSKQIVVARTRSGLGSAQSQVGIGPDRVKLIVLRVKRFWTKKS